MIKEARSKDVNEIVKMMKKLYLTWDFDPIDKVNKKWFSEDAKGFVAKRMRSKEIKYFVTCDNGKPVGYVLVVVVDRPFCKHNMIGMIDEVFVYPEYRKKGFGNQLVKESKRWLKSEGIKWCIVLTHSKDHNANAYWDYQGFSDYNRKYKIRI